METADSDSIVQQKDADIKMERSSNNSQKIETSNSQKME
jgi:hypothetical protein